MLKHKKNLFMMALYIAFLSLWVHGDLYARVDRGTGVPAEALPEGLKGLDIKDYFMPASQKKVGVIHTLGGNVVVVHGGTRDAYFGEEGDVIYEKDSLNTLSDSRCRIRFYDEDVVTMGADTQFAVESFEDKRKEGKKSSIFSMLRGKAMFYALRLFRYKETRFRLKTPTAVVGVRGTKFGAQVYWEDEGKRSDVGLRVADRGNEMGMYLAQFNPSAGSRSYTDVFSVDGYLNVAGKTIGPGEMYMGRTGAVEPTPPGVVRAFEQDVEVKQEGKGKEGKRKEGKRKEGKGKEGEGETTALTDRGERQDPGKKANITEATTRNIQQETTSKTEEEVIGGDIAEGKTAKRVSGIAAIIVDNGNLALTGSGKGPIYTHGPNILSGGAETHVAYEETHEGNDLYKMVVQEESATNMDARVTQFDWDHSPTPTPTLHYFKWHHGGKYVDDKGNEYLSWGWWQDDDVPLGHIATGSVFYVATGKIWEIEGTRTHPDYIEFLQRRGTSYTYSGEAKGVIATSDSSAGFFNPLELSGPFSCQIDFGDLKVSNFTIKASGPGHSVNISGNGVLQSNGDIDVLNMTGTMDGNPVIPNHTRAGGAVVGGKAEGVGGDWVAHDGNFLNAAGEFHGKREN